MVEAEVALRVRFASTSRPSVHCSGTQVEVETEAEAEIEAKIETEIKAGSRIYSEFRLCVSCHYRKAVEYTSCSPELNL